jgi:hypothetical protein
VTNRTIFTISKVIRAPAPPQQAPPKFAARTWQTIGSNLRRACAVTSRHLLNLTALAALLIVLSHATFTTSDATLARYSGLLSDLALALLAAWIFNSIIVDLPRRRDRQRLYTGIAWMVGLMANSGIAMMDFLATAAKENINIDPEVGGVVIPASREATDRICAAIGPETPYVPIPGAEGCWQLIRTQVEKAQEYHRRLQPWLSSFDVEVSAAMNAVILSQLSDLCEEHPRIANVTLENLSEEVYEHWKACDELMAVHYVRVLRFVPGWVESIPRRDRKNFTPAKHHARSLAAAHKAMDQRRVGETT